MSVARAGKRVLAGVYFPEPLMTASICRECCGLGARVEEKKSKGGGRSGKEESSRRSMLDFSSPSPSCQPATAMSAADLGQEEECRTETRHRMENANSEGEKKEDQKGKKSR